MDPSVSAYTTLRVTSGGVLFLEGHLRRLGAAAAEALLDFAAQAQEGVYAVRAEGGPLGPEGGSVRTDGGALRPAGGRLRVEVRPGSRLSDGMPVRRMVSPVVDLLGPLPKQASPSAWDATRASGVITLLTDRRGTEVYEESVAAVVGWDGVALVLPPEDRPRVDSVAERVLAAALPHRRAPVEPSWPLLLINAVVLTCLPAGSSFPAAMRQRIHDLFLATASRG